MDDLGVLVTAALPLLGAVVGATLQYWFSRSNERQKQAELLRDEAYVDYLRTVAQIAIALRAGPRPRELVTKLLEAKSRIAIYGSTSVVEALARFDRGGAVMSEEGSAQYLELCQAMRADSSRGQDPVRSEDLAVILLEGPHDEEPKRPGRRG